MTDLTPEMEPHSTGIAIRLRKLAHKFDIVSMFSAVGIKVTMVIMNFLLITLAARGLSTEQFGHYSVLFSAAGLLYIVAAGGQELFVVRNWSEFFASRDAARLKGAVRYTTGVALTGGAVVGCCFYIWAVMRIGHEEALAALAYLVLASWLQITVHAVRTELGVARADGLNSIVSNIIPVGYLAACLLFNISTSITLLFAALALGNGVSLLLQLVQIVGRIRHVFPEMAAARTVIAFREWLTRSTKFWLSSALEAVNQYIDVIVISYVMDPATAGAYFVTVRLSNLFGAAADAINLFTTRKLPALLFQKDTAGINRTLDNVAWLTLAFIVLGMLGILAGGYFVLEFLNPHYTAYFGALLILCLGTSALAAARTSAISLMLTGHEGLYLRISSIFAPIRVAGVILAAPHAGVVGAVSVTAACFFAQALILRMRAAALVGFDPSIMRLLPGSIRARHDIK